MEAIRFNDLLRRLDEGDETALLILQKEYAKLIKWIAHSILNDWHYAQDIFNEVMITLWNKSRKFKNILNPDALICEITKKAVYSFYRKYLKKSKNDVSLEKLSENDISKFLIHNDGHAQIDFYAMISSLSDKEQDIIIKKTIDNATHAEIAADLRIPPGTAMWKYSNALEKIKKNVEDKKNSS